ncbi:hypothetical protein DY995_10005 [Pseudomonas aeruginosa]|nr:hypothetical protein DY995_10005 [Pseudomonas aeruginosa]
MGNYFESPFRGKLLSEQVSNPNIRVGRYSYYSGYYHGHSFDDCARYLMPDRDDVDKLVIGSFCSIGSGAAFIMAGNQGHRAEWASTFPFHFMHEEPAFAGAVNGYQPAGDTLIGHDVWIGTEAMFMPGVRVGHGAIIGSRALVIYIDSEGQETKRQNGNRIRQLDFDYLLGNAYVCGAPVSLYRMEALRAAGFYDPEIKVQDFQMTLRIASQGYQIHKLPVLVTRYRRHPDNLSRRYKVLLDADLRTIAPYQSHPAYERGRTELVNKALKYAVVADKRHAWQLLRSLPLRQWNRTTFRRLKRFLLHHES